MKHFTLAITLFLLIFGALQIDAKSNSEQESYNMTRAKEELRNGNKASAADYLTKEILANPKNGYAHLNLSSILFEAEDYNRAMSSLNLAIKHLPKKDTETIGGAYASRAKLYAIARDTISALKDFGEALRISPKDTDILEPYGQMLYELDRYDDADAIYNRIVAINPTSVMGYMGLGRNAKERGDYNGAIAQYNKVVNMYEDYPSGYDFRGESYLKLGKYLEGIDDLLKSLSFQFSLKAYLLLLALPNEQLPLAVAKMKAMAVKNPHEAMWPDIMGDLYYAKNMYRKAIEAKQKANNLDASSSKLDMIAECYHELGEYSQALETITQAQQMNPDDLSLISTKADILGNSGDIDGAVAEWTKYIEKEPDYFGGYYRRGFFQDSSGRTDAALDDYNMAILLNPDYAFAYLGKANMLLRKGQREEAMDAYRKVVELDTVPDENSCAMYALLALGEKDKAIDFLNQVIEKNPEDYGVYYDAACLYARMGDTNTALSHLRTSFEKGFRRFNHVMIDDDLDPIRNMPEFLPLIKEFQSKVQAYDREVSPSKSKPGQRVEIPFTPSAGCASVKCEINDLPLTFIFDTGASVLSMSQLEANFMFKNGYLKPEDVVGKAQFSDANGDISEGTVINLREVKFGGLKLENVRASVVRNQRAPLLLGQTVLGRLGSIEIDNDAQKLIIKTQNK